MDSYGNFITVPDPFSSVNIDESGAMQMSRLELQKQSNEPTEVRWSFNGANPGNPMLSFISPQCVVPWDISISTLNQEATASGDEGDKQSPLSTGQCAEEPLTPDYENNFWPVRAFCSIQREQHFDEEEEEKEKEKEEEKEEEAEEEEKEKEKEKEEEEAEEEEEEEKEEEAVVTEVNEDENEALDNEYNEGPQTSLTYHIFDEIYFNQKGEQFQITSMEPHSKSKYPHLRVLLLADGSIGYLCDGTQHKPNSQLPTFKSFSTFNRHYRDNHLHEKRFRCSICGKRFARGDKCKKHKIKQHAHLA